jgi:ribosomal protein L29
MKDLTNKKTEELKTILLEKKVALRNFRFGISGSKTRNMKEGKNLRKDIARILTVLNVKK